MPYLPVVLGVALLVGSCQTTSPPDIRIPPPQVVTPDNAALWKLEGGIYVEVEGFRKGLGVSEVYGKARNETGQDLASVILKFQLLHSDGTLIEEALAATMTGLANGQTWAFQASVFGVEWALCSQVLVSGVVASPRNLSAP